MRDNTTRIIAEGVSLSNDTWETGLNNNDIIVGPSGAGKTRGYLVPALLTAEGTSLIVTDTKGTLYHQYAHRLAERVDFAALRREKTALFINQSDLDRSMDRLISLLYSQAMFALCNTPEAEGEPYLPVRMIMDDFAAGCTVPDFDRIISVVRSRHLYLSIIIQSISQLRGLYGPDCAATILNNCDTMLYLGGVDIDTATYLSHRTDLPVLSILEMPVDEAMLFQRGKRFRNVKRYRPELHGE